jgi:hypothetical protein
MPISASTLIQVPQIYTKSQHFNQLLAMWQLIDQLPDSELDITFDFRKCTFLAHNGVAFLGGLAHWIQSRGGSYTFDWSTLNPRIRNNLGKNGFLRSFGCGQQLHTGNAIPYVCHFQAEKEHMYEYLSQQWLGQGWVDITPPLKKTIICKVMELYNNAFQHSQSPIGIVVCGQRYPNQSRLHLTLVDFGRGIPQTVQALPENMKLTVVEALQWAFVKGNSTARAACGISGLGLNVLQDFLIENQGELKIFSNDGYLRIKEGNIKYAQQKVNFSGTLIDLELRCDQSVYNLAP